MAGHRDCAPLNWGSLGSALIASIAQWLDAGSVASLRLGMAPGVFSLAGSAGVVARKVRSAFPAATHITVRVQASTGSAVQRQTAGGQADHSAERPEKTHHVTSVGRSAAGGRLLSYAGASAAHGSQVLLSEGSMPMSATLPGTGQPQVSGPDKLQCNRTPCRRDAPLAAAHDVLDGLQQLVHSDLQSLTTIGDLPWDLLSPQCCSKPSSHTASGEHKDLFTQRQCSHLQAHPPAVRGGECSSGAQRPSSAPVSCTAHGTCGSAPCHGGSSWQVAYRTSAYPPSVGGMDSGSDGCGGQGSHPLGGALQSTSAEDNKRSSSTLVSVRIAEEHSPGGRTSCSGGCLQAETSMHGDLAPASGTDHSHTQHQPSVAVAQALEGAQQEHSGGSGSDQGPGHASGPEVRAPWGCVPRPATATGYVGVTWASLLSPLQHLIELRLLGYQVLPPPAALAALSALPSLAYLDVRLAPTTTTDQVVLPSPAHLPSSFSAANQTDLSSPACMSDAHLAAVGSLTHLAGLHLSSLSEVTPQGLAHLHSLSRLRALSLCDALNAHTIHDTHIQALVAALPHLDSLALGRVIPLPAALGGPGHTSSGRSALSHLTGLSRLGLQCVHGLDENWVDGVSELVSLRSLEVEAVDLPFGESMVLLARLTPCTTLGYLSLSKCVMYDAHLEAIAQLTQLQQLSLNQVDVWSRDLSSWTGLSSLTALTRFEFQDWNNPVLSVGNLAVLTDDSIMVMTSHWRGLRALRYLGKVQLTYRSRHALATLPHLTFLRILSPDGTCCAGTWPRPAAARPIPQQRSGHPDSVTPDHTLEVDGLMGPGLHKAASGVLHAAHIRGGSRCSGLAVTPTGDVGGSNVPACEDERSHMQSTRPLQHDVHACSAACQQCALGHRCLASSSGIQHSAGVATAEGDEDAMSQSACLSDSQGADALKDEEAAMQVDTGPSAGAVHLRPQCGGKSSGEGTGNGGSGCGSGSAASTGEHGEVGAGGLWIQLLQPQCKLSSCNGAALSGTPSIDGSEGSEESVNWQGLDVDMGMVLEQ